MGKSGPKPTPAPAAWRDILDAYLAHLAAAGYPSTTRSTRGAHLRKLARGLGVSPQRVTGESLVRFFARQEHWARETRRGYRNSCVSFFGWAHREGRIDGNPAEALPSVKPKAPSPRPAPDRVYREALMAADGRVMLMLRLAAEAGLRRAEVAKVHTRDLVEDLDGYKLTVHGKGDKPRTIPITDELGDLLTVGAAGHTPGAAVPGYLFPGDEDGHLSPRYVGKLCAAAMPGEWTLHKLRHRFATRAFRGSRNLRAVQTLLGHASVATTEVYTAVDDAEVRAAMESASAPSRAVRIAGAAGVIAAAVALVAGALSPNIAHAVGQMFSPAEVAYLAAVKAHPAFEMGDRTDALFVTVGRVACSVHDSQPDDTAGDSAALGYLLGHPQVYYPHRSWSLMREYLCEGRVAGDEAVTAA